MGTKYYSNKVADLYPTAKNKKGVYEELMDIISFETPDIEYGEGEITGAGVIGTVNVPDMGNISAPEAKVTGKSYEGMEPLFNPDGVQLKLNWAIDRVNAGMGRTYDSYSAYINGYPKNLPGGAKEKGNGQELEATIAVTYYKLLQNGKVFIEYNPLAGVLIINGVDVMEKINQAVGKA